MESNNKPDGSGHDESKRPRTMLDLPDDTLGEGWARTIIDDILAAPGSEIFADIPPPLLAVYVATANADARTQIDNAGHVPTEVVNDLEEVRREYWREYQEMNSTYRRPGRRERPAPSAIFRRLFMARVCDAVAKHLTDAQRQDLPVSPPAQTTTPPAPQGDANSPSKTEHFELILKEFLGQPDNAGMTMTLYHQIAKTVPGINGSELSVKTIKGYRSKWRGGKSWITKELTSRIVSELENEGRPVDHTYLVAINPN